MTPEPLFGTDGVRGRAGEGPLAPESVARLGVALGEWLEAHGDAGKPALIGGDTRASREEITRALAGGLARRNIRAIDLGVLPTAALALLIDDYGASCAAVISASHNPAADNGIKIFTGHGAKFGDAEAHFVEERWRACPPLAGGSEAAIERSTKLAQHYAESYLEHLLAAAGKPDLRGLSIALDLAHGAAHEVGPALFRMAGARVTVTGDRPDGKNINDGFGSLHPERVAALAKESGAQFGSPSTAAPTAASSPTRAAASSTATPRWRSSPPTSSSAGCSRIGPSSGRSCRTSASRRSCTRAGSRCCARRWGTATSPRR
jgi:phosphoglucosamine mutase